MATGVKSVLDSLGKMTVLELVELKNAIEEEWGVTAAAPVAVAAAPAAGGGDGAGAAEEEKDSFDVVRPCPFHALSIERYPQSRTNRFSHALHASNGGCLI